EATPALVGVGYIMGLRLCSYVFMGGALGWFILMPLVPALLAWFPFLVRPGVADIATLSAPQIWSNYIRYVGAGAVLMGGFISIFKMVPTIYKNLKAEPQLLSLNFKGTRDLPLIVILGLVLVAAVGMLISPLHLSFLTVALILLLSFLFVAVSSRMVGLVGSSSNPISGMTIAALVIISAVLYLTGMRGPEGILTAMSAGAIVCIAAALAGDASQDLKTGYLVGSTPYLQQIAEFIGYIAPTLVIGWALFLLNQTYGFVGEHALAAPQANIMALVVQGIFNLTLPWEWMALGAAFALLMEFLHVPVLAFAVGLYLPVGLSIPLMIGGVAARLTRETQSGTLVGSGMVAGDAFAGVFIAFIAAAASIPDFRAKLGPLSGWDWNIVPAFLSRNPWHALSENPWISLTLFLGLGFWLLRMAKEKQRPSA
ncbi:MAG: OPT/YSL family transporter, partial [bacterium]